MNDYRQEFADNVRKYREAAAYTLEDVADKSGLSTSTWSGFENKRGNPTIDTVAKISETLSVPMSALLDSRTDYTERHIDLKVKTLIKDLNKLEPSKKDHVIRIVRSLLTLIKVCDR